MPWLRGSNNSRCGTRPRRPLPPACCRRPPGPSAEPGCLGAAVFWALAGGGFCVLPTRLQPALGAWGWERHGQLSRDLPLPHWTAGAWARSGLCPLKKPRQATPPAFPCSSALHLGHRGPGRWAHLHHVWRLQLPDLQVSQGPASASPPRIRLTLGPAGQVGVVVMGQGAGLALCLDGLLWLTEAPLQAPGLRILPPLTCLPAPWAWGVQVGPRSLPSLLWIGPKAAPKCPQQ